MGWKRILAALLCVGLISGTLLGCGKDDNVATGQENTQQGNGNENISEKVPVQEGASVLLSGISSSPAYSGGLQTDNGKDPYMATIRERLELEDPEEYLEYEASRDPEDTTVNVSRVPFLGMSVGGLFTKWFWRTEDGEMTGKQVIAAVDVYGAKAEFEADAKPYAPDLDEIGMVVSAGGMAGRDGYVLCNYDSATMMGINVIGEEGRLLARYELPIELANVR